jgi:hypothetical protein
MAREVAALADSNIGYKIDWNTRKFRTFGAQTLPSRIYFDDAEAYLSCIGKSEEAEAFRCNIEVTKEFCPGLLQWAVKHPLTVCTNNSVWLDCLKVCRYFASQPVPRLYIRELPIEVDTKFIERHKGLIDELLQAIGVGMGGNSSHRFEQRYGLKYDEPLIRFRLLDPDLTTCLRVDYRDLAVPSGTFQALGWSGISVVVTENKMNFLTLPELRNTIGVWGGGNAAQLLTSAEWLSRCELLYWGDIDIHGFHIVSRLRGCFSQLRTTMMDLHTIETWQHLLTPAKEASYEEVLMLTEREFAAYELVRGKGMLLEQERIPQWYASQQLTTCVSHPQTPELRA